MVFMYGIRIMPQDESEMQKGQMRNVSKSIFTLQFTHHVQEESRNGVKGDVYTATAPHIRPLETCLFIC